MASNCLQYRGASLIFFSIFLVTSSFSQILPPPPQEISGGAATAHLEIRSNQKLDQDLSEPQQLTSPSTVIEAINLSQDGTNNGGFLAIPPDPHGTAGQDHVVNVVNKSIEWYTKAGTQENSQSLQSFFSSVTRTFDPKVLYDTYHSRFLVVTLELEGRDDMSAATDKSVIYFAVSKTSDPNDGWWKFSFNALTVISSNNTWADYPGFGVDEEAVYIACNMFAHEGTPFSGMMSSYGGVRLWIIPKGQGSGGAYDGGTLGQSIYDPYAAAGAPTFAITTHPAQTYGTTPAGVGTYLVSYGGIQDMSANDYIQLIRVNSPLSSPTFIQQLINLGNIEDQTVSISGAPQMNSDSLIDSGPRRAFNAVWRNGTIAVGFNTLISGEATAYWALISANGVALPSLLNQGAITGEDIATGTYTFYPSVALNMNGDLAIGFSASAPSIYPGAYYTGREAADGAGATDPAETLKAGVDYYERTFGGSRNRWGDYNSTVVDPVDDESFWVYNEYAITRGSMTTMPDEDGRWGTAHGKFQLGDCPNELNLTGTITTDTYIANTINATGMINSPSAVTFDAWTVNMNPTFTVNLGSTFQTLSNGCP